MSLGADRDDDVAAGPTLGRLVGLGLIVLVGAAAGVEALRLGVLAPGGRGMGSPGVGFFPFLAAFGVVIFGGTELAKALLSGKLRRRRLREGAELGAGLPRGLVSVAIYVVALVFYALTLGSLGFPAATAVTVALILRFAEGYRWWTTAVITAATVVCCYLLFNVVLGAHLPAGSLWR